MRAGLDLSGTLGLREAAQWREVGKRVTGRYPEPLHFRAALFIYSLSIWISYEIYFGKKKRQFLKSLKITELEEHKCYF